MSGRHNEKLIIFKIRFLLPFSTTCMFYHRIVSGVEIENKLTHFDETTKKARSSLVGGGGWGEQRGLISSVIVPFLVSF
jgi:hypothetical protein